MTLLYRPVKRRNPRKPEEPQLFYPNPVYRDKINLRALAQEVAERTSISSTDIMATLEACTQVIPFFLAQGDIVSLGDFGSFRVTFTGTGVAEEKDLSAENIKAIKVKFRPGPEFANKMKTVKLEKQQ
jgi:predicted histone-like DNA-binding protein